MEITPMSFDKYIKDTVENRIIKAMMRGDRSVTFDNSNGNIGRCRDELLADDQVAAHLRHKGFQVKRLITMQDEVAKYAGYVVRWGNNDN